MWRQVGSISNEMGEPTIVFSGEIIIGPGSEGDTKSQEDWDVIDANGGFDDKTYTQDTDFDSNPVVNEGVNNTDGTNTTTVLQQGTFCDLPNGETGVINDRGQCVPNITTTGGTFGDFYGVLGSIYNPNTTVTTTTPSTTTTTTPSTTNTTTPSTTTGTTTTPSTTNTTTPSTTNTTTPSTTTGTTTTPTTSTTTGTTTEPTPTTEPGGNVAGNICVTASGGIGVTDSTGACIGIGTGTGTGQGDGDGGNGDGGNGSGGASNVQAARGATYNPFEVQGLNFESVTPVTIQKGNATDFLEGLIGRQSKSLFGDYI